MLDAHDNPKLNEYICKLENEIAKHLETEDKLRDEIHRLRLLVEQSRDGIVILDQYGHVSESNSQFSLMLGYTVEETRSLSVWDWDAQFGKAQLQEMIQVVDFKGDHFVTKHRRKDGKIIDVEISTNGLLYKGEKQIFCICRDVTERVRAEKEREKLIAEIEKALAEIKSLKGILQICSFCKKIRDETGSWKPIELYIEEHSDAEFSHGICSECSKKHYPEYYAKDENE